MDQARARGIKDRAVLLTLGHRHRRRDHERWEANSEAIPVAGHMGHITVDAFGPLDICNTPGSIENAIGNHTIVSRSGGRFSSTEELVAAYESGDAQARDIWLGSILENLPRRLLPSSTSSIRSELSLAAE